MKGPFVHRPIAPTISADFPDQRMFKGCSEKLYAGPKGNKHSDSGATVTRFVDQDAAHLCSELRAYGKGSVTTMQLLKPAALRELAQRLLDAAHDIDTHPSSVLAVHRAMNEHGLPGSVIEVAREWP